MMNLRPNTELLQESVEQLMPRTVDTSKGTLTKREEAVSKAKKHKCSCQDKQLPLSYLYAATGCRLASTLSFR